MTDSADKHDSNDESEDEPDEDPKLMLLVEAGVVPGLDGNLQHLQRHYKKKKNKKKNNKRRGLWEDDTRLPKKSKHDVADEDGYVISKIISHLNKPSKHEAYENCLMMSEWLVKVPEDFEENWVMVPCPPGKRMLIVAASGTTRCFSKTGIFLFFFQSALPGGHLVDSDESSKSLTILDCIWHHKNQTYYVLDMLAWNTSHMFHCEAKFRFFWLQQKLLELGSSLLDESETNHYQFSFLPRVKCKKDELVSTMTSCCFQNEFKENVDGFLFYDVNAPYFAGVTSTVGWLKPFMVSEVFKVPASSELLATRPDDYVSMEQYINEFEENKKQIMRKERKIRAQRLPKKSALKGVRKETNNDVVVKIEAEEDVSEAMNIKEEVECKEMMECDNFICSNSQVHS